MLTFLLFPVNSISRTGKTQPNRVTICQAEHTLYKIKDIFDEQKPIIRLTSFY